MRACGFLSLQAFCITVEQMRERNVWSHSVQMRAIYIPVLTQFWSFFIDGWKIITLTSIFWSELLSVPQKEGLVILCWQIHVVVRKGLFPRHPCVSEGEHVYFHLWPLLLREDKQWELDSDKPFFYHKYSIFLQFSTKIFALHLCFSKSSLSIMSQPWKWSHDLSYS